MSVTENDTVIDYTTRGGIAVRRAATVLTYENAAEPYITGLDERRGVWLASSFDYPGRYTRWDIGLIDPPAAITSRGSSFKIEALNARGRVLMTAIAGALDHCPAIAELTVAPDRIDGSVRIAEKGFPEEERSRQPSVFSVLRAVIGLFAAPDDAMLGLFGAFGYDLAFQFEAIKLRRARDAGQRDLVLYIPDEITVVDHRRETATRYRYDFTTADGTTAGLARDPVRTPFVPSADAPPPGDHAPGEYAATVRKAKEAFKRGDLFEVVPGQMFFEAIAATPSEVFRRLRARNPAPYGALMNLGEGEFLVAASPEMFVRISGKRVETCPISGTIARGKDAIEDSARILELLNSRKDESELTMCTDVDRNDKSRVCEPESVRVIGRRQIEMYSRLIHTVDHVEGTLRDGFDALDAFLTHSWAVTVTGAPKFRAMQFIEDNEKSPRRWYGGAIGAARFDGDMNTGLTLRTIRIQDGVAEVRAGATLLFDSDPDAEEAETRLKASAMLDAIGRPDAQAASGVVAAGNGPGTGKTVVMLDFDDSFVHTLAAYFRTTGASVVTYRAGTPFEKIATETPDLLVLSPGPGRPDEQDMGAAIDWAVARRLPLFGVCLGFQGIVEYFGGTLDTLPEPMHGKPSRIRLGQSRLFAGLDADAQVGRYHSLYVPSRAMPAALNVVAETDDGIAMAIEHPGLAIAGLQFHPESIMSAAGGVGQRIVANAVRTLCAAPARRAEVRR